VAEQAARKTRNRTPLSSVTNAMRLIKAFSDTHYEIGISALAKHLRVAKSTAHRLASTLVAEGVLEQNEHDGKYRLGLALFELGSLVRRKMDITEEAKPHLKALAERTGETLHLAVLDHNSVLYINIIESQRAIRMGHKIGARAPVHCTAIGKALLAFRTQDAIDALFQHGLTAHTANTITTAEALNAELASVRARGYALEDEESEAGLRSVAAAVRNHNGDVVAAIGIAGPVHRVTRKTLLAYARELVDACDAVSQRLGYQLIGQFDKLA
jgi:IclR family KDG regulon transcriptional repressor